MRKVLVSAFAVALIPVASSFAESGVYLSVKDFDWKEDEGTAELVHESGKLIGLGIAGEGKFFGILDSRNRFELYGNSVDYKGYAQDGKGNMYPATTTTTYFGLNFELDLGKKVKVSRDNITFSVMPYTGIGYDFWLRMLDDSKTDTGEPVAGYTELYFIGYAPVGVALKTEYKGIDITAYGQYNYNFLIREKTDAFEDITLKPKRGNAYRLGLKAGYKILFAELFYDYLHLKQSDKEPAIDMNGNSVMVYQPDSKREMLGVNIGLRF